MAQTAFGRNIRALRESKGLRQEDLSEAIGVTTVSISNWERGSTSRPREQEVLEKLKEFFGVEDSDLFGYNDGAYARIHGLTSAPKNALGVRSGGERTVPIRLIGEVHAGDPEDAWQTDGNAPLLESLFEKHPNCYALRVRGTCMNLNFTERDLVFVDPDMAPRDGSIAVVAIDGGDVVVRRVRKGNSSLMLVAETTETEEWADMIFQGDYQEVRLVGTVFWWQSKGEMQ